LNKIYENDQKDATATIIYYSSFALHVSSDIFVYHQEHLNFITASGITRVCRCRLVLWECWNNLVPTLPWYQPAATFACNIRNCNTVYMLLTMSDNIARNV